MKYMIVMAIISVAYAYVYPFAVIKALKLMYSSIFFDFVQGFLMLCVSSFVLIIGMKWFGEMLEELQV